MLLKQLLRGGAVKGEVVALDSTAIKAYTVNQGKATMRLALEGEEEASHRI